ncbi:MAG: hypothetical protein SGILL_000783 [Bacillariaceae sp.]
MASAAEAAAKMSSLSAQLSMALPSFAAKTNAMMEEFLESQQVRQAAAAAAAAASRGDEDEDEGCLHCHRKVKGMPRIERLDDDDEEDDGDDGNKKMSGKKRNSTDDEDEEEEDGEENIQVRCDECQAYICNGCHWCHEFQANHEIRVCDRCDAFYCKACDEMDQCDDCGEVVCGSCSTLLSCKFCGGGLCEECATALDCDTCRLSYCLVCLASGSKDPCVRCGHRPSKRMEQLVHLRLKSIYKAFKSSSNNAKAGTSDTGGKSNTMSNAAMASAAAANAQQQQQQFNQSKSSSSSHHHDHSHHGPRRKKPTTLQDMVGDDDDDEDLANADSDSMMMMGNVLPAKFCHDLEQNYLAEQKKADAAAEALLAELEEEEEANAKKKSKKKKKKERKQAKKDAEEPQSELQKDDGDNVGADSNNEGEAVENDASDAESKNRFSPEVQDEEDDTSVKMDPVEKELMECVENGYIDGIEDILFRIKGVPGRAILRKNAKKALKRLVAEMEGPGEEEAEFETVPETKSSSRHSPSTSPAKNTPAPKAASRSSSAQGNAANKNETFVPISSTLVGWVIGKGGQRIRDMMEASGAKIWVDQEKVKGQPTRNVFISGDRRCVEQGVMLVKEVISNAPPPPGSAPTATGTVGATAPSGAVASSQPVERSSLVAGSGGADAAPPANKSQTMADRLKESTHTDGAAKARESQPLRASTPGNDSGLITEVVSCETRFVPLLIGKRGWTIKNIQDESGARVDIDQTVTPRQIKVSGGRATVDKAVTMVRDVLSYPHAQLQHGTDDMEFVADGDDAPAMIVREHAEAQPPSPTKVKLLAASARLEKESDRKDVESPPPIVGDAKSAISASSSLSSTPEPSMASSAKGALASQQLQAQLHNGPLIPPGPQQFAPGTASNLSNPTPNYPQSEMAMKNVSSGSDTLGAVRGTSAAPYNRGSSGGHLEGVQGRIEMHQGSIPQVVPPHTSHQSHHGLYGASKAPPMQMNMVPPQLQQQPQHMLHHPHRHSSQPLSSSFDPAGSRPSRSSMPSSSQYDYNGGMNQSNQTYSRSSQGAIHTPYSREVANAIATTPLRNLMGRTLTRGPPPSSSPMRSSSDYRGREDDLWQQQANQSYPANSRHLSSSGMQRSAPLSAPSGPYPPSRSTGYSSHHSQLPQLHHAHSADSALSGSMGFASTDAPLSHQPRSRVPFSNTQSALPEAGFGPAPGFPGTSRSAAPSQQKQDDSRMLESLFGTGSNQGPTSDAGASNLLAGLNSLSLGNDTGAVSSSGLWGPSSLTDSWAPSGAQTNSGGAGAPSSLGDILSGPMPSLPLDKSQESRFQWK